MTTTILAVIALTGPLVANKPEFQAQTDYGQAMKLAANEKKPMVVLIGKGDAFAKLMKDMSLPSEAKKLLTEKFVCVSVNVETEAGKKLAEQFDLTDGLVISSAGGTHQALRQSGPVTATELAKHAGTYANTTGTPSTTVTVGQTILSQPASTPSAPPIYSTPSTPPVYSTPSAYPSTVYPAGGYPAGGYQLPGYRGPSGLPCVGNR